MNLYVVDRDDGDDAWSVGIDLHKMMQHRPERFALLALEPNGMSVAFADDASVAASLVLDMCRYGTEPPATLECPEAVRSILRHHAAGCH